MENLNLKENLILALEKKGITNFTKIQEESIPLILDNKNLIGESSTGSGKTLAFLLPIFSKMNLTEKGIQALILAPTHELASQINSEIKLLNEQSNSSIKSALIIGGANIANQLKKLKEKPQIVVGTPNRIFELIQRKKFPTHTLKTIVLDEADHLLDRTNINNTITIMKSALKDCQKIAFSATITEKTIANCSKVMSDFEIVKISRDTINKNISHIIIESERRDKLEVVNKVLNTISPNKCMIFTNSSNDANLLLETLEFHKKDALLLAGDKNKFIRKDIIKTFKESESNILISSDVSSRGLHIPNVSLVISLDYPLSSNEYIHRSGRTGRNDTEGISVCIATKRELKFINTYSKELDLKFEKKSLKDGELV